MPRAEFDFSDLKITLVFDVEQYNKERAELKKAKSDRERRALVREIITSPSNESWGNFEVSDFLRMVVQGGFFPPNHDDLIALRDWLRDLEKRNEFVGKRRPVAIDFEWEEEESRVGARLFLKHIMPEWAEVEQMSLLPSYFNEIEENSSIFEFSVEVRDIRQAFVQIEWLRSLKVGDIVKWIDEEEKEEGEFRILFIDDSSGQQRDMETLFSLQSVDDDDDDDDDDDEEHVNELLVPGFELHPVTKK